jgi:hydrogenase maturation protein HypF
VGVVTVAIRRRLRVEGVVQGVGFRPFAQRVACELGLVGHVGNDAAGVFAEVEGPPDAVGRFLAALGEGPRLARVDSVTATSLPPAGETCFRIVPSVAAAGAATTFVAPDTAVCDDCLGEMWDPTDRRYRHPFITCTNCGPRFTITLRLPYDRPNTTMAGFPMCGACAAEYSNPTDRRFHAQPLCCPDCGPELVFSNSAERRVRGDAAIRAAQEAVSSGAVVAVKGVGGYHLACDPWSSAAVANLRNRKARVAKPFAVMARNMEVARRLAAVSPAEASLLQSPARPIVLLSRHDDLAPEVAPDNPLLGVMLPYSPLHHLLLEGFDALVMTSGNLSDEPIAYEDADARQRLAGLADAWLTHDRPIHVPCDDSVVRVVDGVELPIRRSRGYAPLPVTLPVAAAVPTLAVGGELKTTFCLARGRDAWLSQHIGDMGSVETLAAFERSGRQFGAMYDVEASQVVADLHPGYHTRQWAERRVEEPVLVQHHHAHVAALMAEHGVPPDEVVLGVAFDGTGYGPDGAIWGGEILCSTYRDFQRVAHLAYIPLPGGDAAIRNPGRAALAHLWAAGIAWHDDLPPVRAAGDELAVLRRQLEVGAGCVPTSSMGRLFDAVASLLGLHHTVTYEAQAAMALEAVAVSGTPRPYSLADLDPGPMLQAIVADLRAGVPVPDIAAGFHAAIAQAVAEVAAPEGLRVALTGGCFQNALLTHQTRKALEAQDLEVLTHHIVPPNDGGLSLGQLAIVASQSSPPRSGRRGRDDEGRGNRRGG